MAASKSWWSAQRYDVLCISFVCLRFSQQVCWCHSTCMLPSSLPPLHVRSPTHPPLPPNRKSSRATTQSRSTSAPSGSAARSSPAWTFGSWSHPGARGKTRSAAYVAPAWSWCWMRAAMCWGHWRTSGSASGCAYQGLLLLLGVVFVLLSVGAGVVSCSTAAAARAVSLFLRGSCIHDTHSHSLPAAHTPA